MYWSVVQMDKYKLVFIRQIWFSLPPHKKKKKITASFYWLWNKLYLYIFYKRKTPLERQ